MAKKRCGQRTSRAATLALALLATLLAPALGLAQSGTAAAKFPAHAIRMIVPSPPGGPTDVIARLLAGRMASALAQPVTVEDDDPDGMVAVKHAANAAPDGYTLLLASPGPLAIAPAIEPKPGYDPAKALASVAVVSISPQVLVVNAKVPANSVHDLIAYARANPGKIRFASPGYATQPHVLAELLKTTAGVTLGHVPCTGPAPAMAELLSDRAQMLFDGPAAIAPYVATGRLHALAVASETRTRLLPGVPTMMEAGFGRFIANSWTAIVVPNGTPAQIITRLNGVINDSLGSSEAEADLAKLGAEPKRGSPADAAAFVSAEAAKWAVIAKAAGLRPN